ncbi:SdpI family protein [Croceibacterium aestuarii]|uniref:SdpI family protein n=1 Tax=Croceibacterium aestuarii TaxID=3064139 RepID=UPI00272E6FEF|nr:SdpI family protein [Croceibacterium sp. D39]
MKTGKLLLISLVVCAAMSAFAFYAAARLPAGAELATHWNLSGEADRTQPALMALLLPAGIGLLVSLVFSVLPRIEPLQDRLEASAPLMRTAWIGVLVLLVFVQAMIGAQAFGYHVRGDMIMLPLGLFLLVLGNVLPKSRPGFFVGIRTPWTIVDEDVWIATHRLGGKLMMLAGAVLVVLSLLPFDAHVRGPVMLAVILASALVPIVYSWWLWSRKKRGA